jgi:hypothetical protein
MSDSDSDSKEVNSEQPETRLGRPKTSSNNLADLCKWLKMGDIVVLVSGNFMMPYAQRHVPNQDPASFRVIYMDITSHASLGHEGEWPWYFDSSAKARKFTEGPLIERLRRKDFPHMFSFRLGY